MPSKSRVWPRWMLLAKYRTEKGFQPYDKLSETDRKNLQAPVNALAEDLAKLRGILGLN